jgi:hypothetical protein
MHTLPYNYNNALIVRKHVEVDVLKHYCNSNEVCAFVGLIITTKVSFFVPST